MKNLRGIQFILDEKILYRRKQNKDYLRNILQYEEVISSEKAEVDYINSITNSNNIEKILLTEKECLNFDLAHFASNPSTETSMKEGLADMERIEKSLSSVSNPNIYKEINEQYTKKVIEKKDCPKILPIEHLKGI